MLSDLLFQPFCWLTFSHWTTNSANCGRASHTNEKQGTAALFASQKPGCLQWFQTQLSSLRGSPCFARTERKISQGKAEVGAFVSISTTRGVMKGTYTLLTLSHVRSHRCDQSWLVPEAYDHTGVIRTFSASRHQLLNSNLLSCFGWRGARLDALSICHIITTIQCFQPYNAYFRLQTFKHA